MVTLFALTSKVNTVGISSTCLTITILVIYKIYFIVILFIVTSLIMCASPDSLNLKNSALSSSKFCYWVWNRNMKKKIKNFVLKVE